MAKRFTDSRKWDKAWFRKLKPKMKCAREFLQDKCDHAGAWEIDMETMSFFVGETVTLDELLQAFGARLEIIDEDKLWLVDFCDFQYGELKEDYNPHKPAVKRLKELDLFSRVAQGLAESSASLMDKDKNKDKDKDKEKDKEKVTPNFDFDLAVKPYPRKVGKQKALKNFAKQIKAPEDYADFCTAVANYAKHCEVTGKDKQFIMQLSTFVGTPSSEYRWRDWIDPDPSELQAASKGQGYTKTKAEQVSSNLIGLWRKYDEEERSSGGEL